MSLVGELLSEGPALGSLAGTVPVIPSPGDPNTRE
jgi:hypothetical protein